MAEIKKIKYAVLKFPEGDFVIELWEVSGKKQCRESVESNKVGNVHLSLAVNNMEYSYKSLENKGVDFVGAPAEVTAGVNKGAYAIYTRAQNGLICELFQGKSTQIK